MDGSQILDQKSLRGSKPDDDEFNINLLNSEFDQPRNSNGSSQKVFTPTKFDLSVKLTSNPDLKQTVAKLEIELAVKDAKIREIELSRTVSSPISDIKSPQKDENLENTTYLKTQLTHAENELSKKTALFEQECKYWSEKSEKDKKIITNLRKEIQSQNDQFQHVIINKFEKKISLLQVQNEDLNEKVQSIDNLLTIKAREVEKELALRKNNELEYEVETKKKNYKIQDLEQSLR
jgi:hypothetical protein